MDRTFPSVSTGPSSLSRRGANRGDWQANTCYLECCADPQCNVWQWAPAAPDAVPPAPHQAHAPSLALAGGCWSGFCQSTATSTSFWTISRALVSSNSPHTRVCCTLLGTHAEWVLIGAGIQCCDQFGAAGDKFSKNPDWVGGIRVHPAPVPPPSPKPPGPGPPGPPGPVPPVTTGLSPRETRNVGHASDPRVRQRPVTPILAN